MHEIHGKELEETLMSLGAPSLVKENVPVGIVCLSLNRQVKVSE